MRRHFHELMMTSKLRSILACPVFVLLQSLAFALHAQQLPLEQAREAEKHALIERQRAIVAPAALPADTFLAWAAEVHLDDETRQSFTDFVEGYRLRLPGVERDLRSKIAELFPASFEFDRDSRSIRPVPSPQLLELYDLHARLIERMLDLERPVVRALLAPLDAAGQARIETAWLRRLQRLRGLSMPAPPAVTIDPIDVLEQLTLEDQDRAQVDPVIAQYRRDMISFLEDKSVLSPIGDEADRVRIELELGPAWELFFDDVQTAEITARINRPGQVRLYDQVAKLNQVVVADVAALLPPRQAIELRSQYVQHILPDFFDEEREVLALADTIRAIIDGLEGEDAASAREALDRGLASAGEELDITAQAALALSPASAEPSMPVRLRESAAEAARRAAADLAVERDMLEVRRERRRIFGRALDAIQTAAQHSPDYVSLRDMFEEFRRIQRNREEADEFRQRALMERIEGLAALAIELDEREDR
jgi:hypothetical protein